jgi:exopolysaccharide biosynthesis polyprenyl glycosylphosphotransferase
MSGYRQSVEVLYTAAAMPQSPVLEPPPVLPPSLTGTRTANRTRISARTFQWLVTAVEVGADFFTSVAAVFLARYACQALHLGHSVKATAAEVALVATAVGLLVTLFFERESAYRGTTSLLRIRETERALKVPFVTLLLLLPVSLRAGQLLSRVMLALLAGTLPALLLLQKWLVFSLLRSLHTRGYGVQRVVVYGAGSVGRRLFTALAQSPKLGFLPVAILDDRSAPNGEPVYELGYSRRNAIDILNTPVTKEIVRSLRCDTLFIDVDSLNHEAIFAAMQVANEERLQVAFLHDQLHPAMHRSESFDLDGMLLTLHTGTGHLPLYSFIKRLADVTASALLLTLLSPLLVLIALFIRLDSRGPVFFRQNRIGKNGRQFEMVKFRSMYVGSPAYARSPVTTEDCRITRAGRLLRRTSFDELPQLFNVLKGDMSLVGPRPEMPFLVQDYSAAQRQRLQVLPGITGLWQLSADRAFLIHENPEYDAYYIRNRSFFLDSAILLHTLLFAMRGI